MFATASYISPLTSDPVKLPSAEILDTLYQLALMGDLTAVKQHVDGLPLTFAPLAAQLRELTESLNEEALISLLKQYKTILDGRDL